MASLRSRTGAGALLRSLRDQAEVVRQARQRSGRQALAEDRFGPDPFGLRDLAAPPPQLDGVRLTDVPTEELGNYFRALDMAGIEGDTRWQPKEIWSERRNTPSDWWWPEDRPSNAKPLPALPETLEAPKVFHTIWLGGPVTDGRPATDQLRRNLRHFSVKAQTEGMRVVLWTDVSRDQFGRGTSHEASMLGWARQHRITLLNPDEVFHSGEPMSLAAEYKLETSKGTAVGYTAASDICGWRCCTGSAAATPITTTPCTASTAYAACLGRPVSP